MRRLIILTICCQKEKKRKLSKMLQTFVITAFFLCILYSVEGLINKRCVNNIYFRSKIISHQPLTRRCSQLNLSSNIIIPPMIGTTLRNSIKLPLFTGTWQVWAVLSTLATFGVFAEKTDIGSTLSSPITTMIASLILSNIGIIPSSSSVYNVINKFLLPLAIPLLLLDADLRKCIKVTGRLLYAFLIGIIHILY